MKTILRNNAIITVLGENYIWKFQHPSSCDIEESADKKLMSPTTSTPPPSELVRPAPNSCPHVKASFKKINNLLEINVVFIMLYFILWNIYSIFTL